MADNYIDLPVEGGGGGGGVTSLNSLTGALTLLGGTGITITPSGSNITITNTGAVGTVTSVSVVSANGLAGTVATATTTPAITLSTTITGILQGNGTAISAATTGNLTDAGTDGIVITGGAGAVLGSGTSIAQHVADTTHNGYLSSTDWNTFNGKQAALSITNLTDVGTDGITITNGAGAVIGASPVTIAQQASDATHNGYLTSANWTTFNGKQAAGNYITALTGDVTASGPGSVAASLVATTNATITTLSALTSAASLATVGTITAGTWAGTVIGVTHGGTGLTSTTANQLLYSSATSTIAGLSTANKSLLVTDGSGVPSISNQLPLPLGINRAAGANGVYIQNVGDNNDGALQLQSTLNSHKVNFYMGNNGFFGINVVDNSNFFVGQNSAGGTVIGGTATPEGTTSVTASQAANMVQFAIRGHTTQTHDLQQWKTSTPTVLLSVDQNGLLNSAVAQTTVTGSGAGTAVFSQPNGGSSYKKVVVYLNGYTDSGAGSYTYPVAFSHTPAVSGLAAGVSGATATTTSVSFNVTTLTGFVFIEGY